MKLKFQVKKMKSIKLISRIFFIVGFIALLLVIKVYLSNRATQFNNFYRLADNIENKELFTPNYKSEAIACFSILNPNVEWEKQSSESFLNTLGSVFQIIPTDFIGYKSLENGFLFSLQLELKLPLILTFTCLDSPSGLQIDYIENFDNLMDEISNYRLVSKDNKPCL